MFMRCLTSVWFILSYIISLSKVSVGRQFRDSSVARNLVVLLDVDLQFREHVSLLIKRTYNSLKTVYKCNFLSQRSVRWDCLVLSHFN